MTGTVLLTTDVVCVLAWAFPLIMAVLHRTRGVPRRLAEIEQVFIGPPEGGRHERERSTPGSYYLTLFRPLEDRAQWTRDDLTQLIRNQFFAWHSWGRYLFPLSLILVIAAVELKFCRDWVVVQLDMKAVHPAVATRAPGAGQEKGPTSQSGSPSLSMMPAGTSPDTLKSPRVPRVASQGSPGSAAVTGPMMSPSVGIGDTASQGTGASISTGRAKRGDTTGSGWLRTPTREEMAGVPITIIMALLGAFTWSVYEILSRRYSRELTPQELSEITLRLIAAIPIGYAFSQIALDKWDAPLAFAASALPVRELQRIMRQRMLDKASAVPGSEDKPTAHLGQVIEGVSNKTAARLEELNITTALDLAYADPIALMAQTGYSLRLILTWMDQALLVVYFGGSRSMLIKLGIPCALDLCEFYVNHCQDGATKKLKSCSDDPAVIDLAQRLDIPVSILPERLHALFHRSARRVSHDELVSGQSRGCHRRSRSSLIQRFRSGTAA